MESYNKYELSMLCLDQSSEIDINNDKKNVFPAVNHEEKLSEENQTLSKLPSSQLNASSQRNVTNFLHQCVTCIYSWLRNHCVSSGGRGIISFLLAPPTALATVLFVLWYLRLQKQRRIREGSRRHLIRIVRERDGEIGKLMRQIAHMNKLLYGVATLSPRTT